MDKNKLVQYIVANMGHVIHNAVGSLKASGKLPKDASASDFWEHGIHGLMQAVHGYDPNKGDLNAYAKKKIMGLIQEASKADKHSYVPRSLESDARSHSSQNPQAAGQTAVTQGSTRGAVESAGGSMDESGAANLSSIKNFDRQFADKNPDFVNSQKFKDKMARYEGKFEQPSTPAPEVTPVPSPSAESPAAPAAPAPVVVRRRPAMKPEQTERLQRVDSAKASQGKKDGA